MRLLRFGAIVVVAAAVVAVVACVAWIAWIFFVPTVDVASRTASPTGEWIAESDYVQHWLAVSPVYRTVILEPGPFHTGAAREVFRMEVSTGVDIATVAWRDPHSLIIEVHGAESDIVSHLSDFAGVSVHYSFAK